MRSLKKSGLQRDSNPWPPRYRCDFTNFTILRIYCDDHSSLHIQPQYKYELFHIYFTSLHCTGKYELNKLTSLPTYGFIAQLVEHRTAIAEVTGSNPVEALIFSGFSFPIAYIGKFTAMITLHFIYNRSTNMNYFIYTSQESTIVHRGLWNMDHASRITNHRSNHFWNSCTWTPEKDAKTWMIIVVMHTT